MKTNKKIIIIGTMVWILALIATFIFASDNTKNKKEKINSNNNDEKVEKEENKKVVYKGVTLYDTYDENDIVITEKIISEDENYIVISGLKDKEIEKKVNDKIYNLYSEGGKKFTGCNEKSNKVSVEANFGDIISVLDYSTCSKNGKFEYNSSAITINLNNGEEIKFDELFTTDEIISSLLADNMSYYLAKYYEFNKDDPSSALHNYKESDLEDLTYMSVQEIRNNKNSYFYITNELIRIYWRGVTADIYVVDNLDNIAYFTRFKNKESIYTDDKVGKENRYLALSDGYYRYGNSRFEEIGDHILVDYRYFNFSIDDDEFITLLDKLKVTTNLENMIKNAPKDKFTYINNISYVEKNEDYEFYIPYDIRTQVCTMSKELYNDSIKEYIFKRKSFDDRFNVDNSNIVFFDNKDVKCEEVENISSDFYNKEGKVIETLDDIFKDGYDYQSVINDEIKKQAIKQLEVSEETITIDIVNIESTLSYPGVSTHSICNITNNDTGSSFELRVTVDIPYEKFERSKMKI